MMASWPCPLSGGGPVHEHAFAIVRQRPHRVLVVPALFDEANRLRRLIAQTMRQLDARGIDSILIDLPGCNESLQPLPGLGLDDWHQAVAAAARHFGASHILAIRAGALAVPKETGLPVLAYAPVTGASVLRQMARMRVLSSREAGREETAADILATGRTEGITLAGYPLSPRMIRGLEASEPVSAKLISQSDIGGGALWLRAEPGENPAQAEALAARIATECGA